MRAPQLLLVIAVALLGVGIMSGCTPGSNGSRPAPAADARPTAVYRDDLGREVTLPVPVTRLVVFNRYTTEFVRAIAGMRVVVGFDVDVRRSGGYWPDTGAAMVVGQAQSNAAPNYEAIVETRPDVVFFARNGPWEEASRALAPFHIPVFVITGWDVLKHEENVDTLGRILDRPREADRLNAFYRRYRDLLHDRLAGAPRPRVYIEEVGDYKALLKGSGWHDMVESGGGLNVFGDINILDQPTTRGTVQGFDTDAEEILHRRPDVLIKLYSNQHLVIDEAEAQEVLRRLVARPGFADLPAVAGRQVYSLSYYHASACSKIIGALRIAKWLHPERFADVDPDEAMRQWLEDFQGVPAPGHYWTALAGRTP